MTTERVETPPDTRHEMNVLALSVGDDPPFMYQAQCSCGWNSEETPEHTDAVAAGRNHLAVRAEKATVHPWLDTK